LLCGVGVQAIDAAAPFKQTKRLQSKTVRSDPFLQFN